MAFQLVVDNRVKHKTDSLEDAVIAASDIIKKKPEVKIEIVNLSGGISSKEEVIRLVESLTAHEHDEER